MTDEVDRAQNEMERVLAQAQSVRKPTGPVPTGRCLYCDEIVDDSARWCNVHCRDAWQELPARLR